MLSLRALNRALLARQWLLRRVRAPVADALEHLVGLQAQSPQPPYVGLWTRLADFRPEELSTMLSERAAVRIPLMRSTIHLVTASDCLALRPVVAPALEHDLVGSRHAPVVAGLPVDELRAATRAALAEQPCTPMELGARLQQRWPDVPADSLAYVVRTLLPLVQIPPRGLWGRSGAPKLATAEDWIGRPVDGDKAPDRTVLRYLAAFGPATVADLQWWSGLPRQREVLDRLRPKLRTFRTEGGAELFDLPDAPRPAPDTTAPLKFLPQFDNILLSHADRTRIVTDEHRRRVIVGGIVHGSVVVHGFVTGSWRIDAERGTGVLTVQPFTRWSRTTVAAAEREGGRLLAFASTAKHLGDVRIGEP